MMDILNYSMIDLSQLIDLDDEFIERRGMRKIEEDENMLK